jgi:hypothetical protein
MLGAATGLQGMAGPTLTPPAAPGTAPGSSTTPAGFSMSALLGSAGQPSGHPGFPFFPQTSLFQTPPGGVQGQQSPAQQPTQPQQLAPEPSSQQPDTSVVTYVPEQTPPVPPVVSDVPSSSTTPAV